MKRRVTEIVTDKSIGSSGEVVTADLPSDFAVTALVITQVGANVTDEATLAELLAGITWLELTTRGGSPIKISGTDLYYFNRDYFGQIPYTNASGEATDNQIRYLSLVFPLNPIGIWDTSMGIAPTEKGKVRVTMGTDTAAGADGRTLIVTAIGIEGIAPWGYMGMFQDSYTSVVGDNFRDIQQEKVVGLMGIYAFQTTGLQDITTTDAVGVQKFGYAISQSIKEAVRPTAVSAYAGWTLHPIQHVHVLTEGAPNTMVAAVEPINDYVFWELGARDGTFVPWTDKLQCYMKHGVAEATRLYPMLAVRN